MTLLEMIKKYEKVEKTLREPRLPGSLDVEDSFSIVAHILKDLRSVETHPSVTNICDKILQKLDRALTLNDFQDAQTLAHILSLLPE